MPPLHVTADSWYSAQSVIKGTLLFPCVNNYHYDTALDTKLSFHLISLSDKVLVKESASSEMENEKHDLLQVMKIGQIEMTKLIVSKTN